MAPHRLIAWTVLLGCQFAAGGLYAEPSGVDADSKLITGRLGAGALVGPRYSGAASDRAWPVPLASLEFGDYAYVDYWEAGLYVLANQEKTLGLALVAAPRLGFNSSDGPRVAGMMTRKSSLEAGVSLDYGSDTAGVSLAYLHDITQASEGGTIRLLGFRRIEIKRNFGLEAVLGVERLSSNTANYYYGVGSTETNSSRPFYQPGSGVELSASLHFNYDFGARSTILFGYEGTLLGDVIAESPIVERRITNFFYIGYGWRL